MNIEFVQETVLAAMGIQKTIITLVKFYYMFPAI